MKTCIKCDLKHANFHASVTAIFVHQNENGNSDFIWPFLRPYMGLIPNPKMAFIFPISCILALIFPILLKYFPKCEGKGSFLKSQIKSLGNDKHHFGKFLFIF